MKMIYVFEKKIVFRPFLVLSLVTYTVGQAFLVFAHESKAGFELGL